MTGGTGADDVPPPPDPAQADIEPADWDDPDPACCPSPIVAASRYCGCGGSGSTRRSTYV